MDDQRYCEDSYEEYATRLRSINDALNTKAKVEGVRTAEEVVKDTAEKLAKIDVYSKSKEALNEKVTYRETISFSVPTQDDDVKQQAYVLNTEQAKETILRAILQAISTDTRFTCERGSNIHLTIPKFDVGDPGIYIQVVERRGWYTESGVSVAFLGFGQDAHAGAFKITKLQRIGRKDEVELFITKIREKIISEQNLICE